MEITILNIDEFSDARKAAMKEIYGDGWRKHVEQQIEQINSRVEVVKGTSVSKKTEFKKYIADIITAIIEQFEPEMKKMKLTSTSPIAAAYNNIKKQEKSEEEA